MGRKTGFILTLLSILSVCFLYLYFRISRGAIEGVFLFIVCALVFTVPVVYWVGDRDGDTTADELIQKSGFVAMGVLSFLLLFALIRDLMLFIFVLLRLNSATYFLYTHGVAWVWGLTFVSLCWGGWSAARGPRIKKVEVRIDGLPKGLDGFKIAQISDLHIGVMIDQDYVKKTVALTQALEADVVALTGDIIDESLSKIREIARDLGQLAPKGKIFYAPGNHEYYWNGPEWFHFFREIGIRVLLNESEIIQHGGENILIGGVVDYAAEGFTKQKPDATLAAQGEAAFKILLAHQPKIAPLAEAAGFDLQLSGHTHGGQFFPWTWLAKRVHPVLVGIARVGKMWIYVSPGTGSWGPPIRLGTSTEVTLLTLKAVK